MDYTNNTSPADSGDNSSMSSAPSMPTNSQPRSSYTPPGSVEQSHRKIGPIVATLIIVVVLVIAALYIFASYINKQPANPIPSAVTSDTSGQNVDTSANALQSVPQVTNTNDDPQSLQNDLNTATQGVDSQSF